VDAALALQSRDGVNKRKCLLRVVTTGATVTVGKYAMALLRVSTRAGRFLSGAANW
jgi:hypothetical protein